MAEAHLVPRRDDDHAATSGHLVLYRRSGGHSWSEGSMDRLKRELLEYHERSKHRVNCYAPGPGGLDWTTQPDPFRVFHGHTAHWPAVSCGHSGGYTLQRAALRRPAARAQIRSFQSGNPVQTLARPVGVEILWRPAVGTALQPFERKSASDRGLPSLCRALPGSSGGLCHYLSRDHALEHGRISESLLVNRRKRC